MSDAKRAVKDLRGALADRLRLQVSTLDDTTARQAALNVLQCAFEVALRQYVAEHLRQVTTVAVGWWDKYGRTLSAFGTQRTEASTALDAMVDDLGYEHA